VLVSFLLSDPQEDTVSYSLTSDSAPGAGSDWFTPTNARQVPTQDYTGGEWVSPRRGGETGATPPPPATEVPCTHERTVEQLRAWLSRQPFDGRVVVGDVLLRLGRAPRAGA